jgi:hypothetical protein
MFLSEIQVRCPYCNVKQWIEIDPSEGQQQALIIDCEVCCRPLELSVVWDESRQKFVGSAGRSSGIES